ncbi:hypothetical protein PG994_004235 [Apiospora phragmitis]|uniref:Uncharacterized protein n=1 Tax=Apiospora phragmitis TaxID=2905665 RepID=A0ABR1VQ14_9PEZI
MAHHVHQVFFVDEVLGIRRTADTELLLQWSKTEMDRADVLPWGDTGFRVHPSTGPAGEDRYVIEWDPTWVARGELGPDLLAELALWEQILEREEQRGAGSKGPIQELLIVRKYQT